MSGVITYFSLSLIKSVNIHVSIKRLVNFKQTFEGLQIP